MTKANIKKSVNKHFSEKKAEFITFDGTKLFRRDINPHGDFSAVMVIVHGLNEHSGRYKHLINALGETYALRFIDLRGHGHSEGVKSYVKTFDEFARDIDTFIDAVKKENPGKPIVLLGHSMGGQIALNTAARFSGKKIAALITSSANVQLVNPIHPIKKMIVTPFGKLFPKMRLANNVLPEMISRDPETVQDYREDPLITASISANLGLELIENQKHLLHDLQNITVPTFLMHGGDDPICSPNGSKAAFKKIKSHDKTLKIYPGFYHEIFNEIGREEVFEDLRAWLKKRFYSSGN